jgi:glycerophosphoryl diester phosphodiesterase
VPQSGGLEGLGFTPDGRLIAALEKGLVGDAGHRTWFQAYDPKGRKWTGERWAYPLDARAISVGEIAMLDGTHGFAIERDGTQGDPKGFKRIFRFTLGPTVAKRPAADLLDLRRHGRPYTFPYECPEGLAVVDARHLLVVDDNNYPFGHGRRPDRPDDSELLLISLP